MVDVRIELTTNDPWSVGSAVCFLSRVELCNSALSDALRAVPNFAAGDWVWVYNTAATIRQGAKTDTGAKVLKAKLSLKWTGPCKALAVGPCTPADTPDCLPSGRKSPMFGSTLRHARRLSVQRCKLCVNPHDHDRHAEVFASGLPAGLTHYVLNNFSKKISAVRHSRGSFDSSSKTRSGEKITGHQAVRGRGGVIAAVTYARHFTGLSGSS